MTAELCFHRTGQRATINMVNTMALLLKLCKWCHPHRMAVAAILRGWHDLEMDCSFSLCYGKKRRKKYNCSTTKVTLTSAPCGIGLKLFSGVVAVTEVSVGQNILMQDYHWLWESINHMWSTTTFIRNRRWPHTCWNHTTTEGWQSVLDKLCTGNEEFHYNFHSENLLQCESDVWEVGCGYYLP